MRLIDADALTKAITEHGRSEVECLNHFWYDENIVALIDNAPTVEEKMYREETCNHKNSCDDYKYWHCIGCNGCKKGGAE